MAQELITMTPKKLSRYEIIKRLIAKEINGTEASKQLDLSVRQIKRVKAKVKKHGVGGIIHGLRGKQSNKQLPDKTIKKIKQIVEDKYHDLGPTFAVKPQKKGNLHKSLTKWEKNNLKKIFSIQTPRTVSNDFTVRHQGKWCQLSEIQPTLVSRKDKILMEERTDGVMFISLRGKYLEYEVLPKRPEKINQTKVIALTRTKPSWKPPVNHPWRKLFIINPAERRQSSSSSVDAS